MKYNPPTNGDLNNPNRPFINADPSNGIAGSYPSAQSIEHPQREILAVIAAAGLDPDEEDLTQLAQAIDILVSDGKMPPAFFRNYIAGLTLSNNVGDAVNDIDIASGFVVDDSLTSVIHLPAAMTKRLDAVWSVGNGGGGLDTGAKANSTTYHIFLILNPTSGAVDVLYSTSLAPAMPAGFTKKRRIGSLFTTAAGAWISFIQSGNEFRYKAPTLDVNTTFGTAPVLYTLPFPIGLKVKSICRVYIRRVAADAYGVVSDPDMNFIQVPNSTSNLFSAAPLPNIGTGGGTQADGKAVLEMYTDTNTSAQLRAVSHAASTNIEISAIGFIDERKV